ncbi:MAG: hypothetical protein NTW85_11840 [Methylococcales bacterium]|nr:hypothetical protein [Methylococcales bacterium]
MENTPDSQKSARAKVSVNELSPLVAHGKSKKLAAIANKSAIISPPTAKTAVFSSVKSEPDSALQQARQLIDARIHDIMRRFPEGRRTKLFTIRFGSVAKIQSLEIKAAFKLLDIPYQQLNMRLLATLNYHGDSV